MTSVPSFNSGVIQKSTPPLTWCRGMPGICLPGVTKMSPFASAKGLFGEASFPLELIGSIDESIIGVDEVLSRLVVGTRFQPLAACKWNVLKHASALDDARDLNNVVLAVGMEQPELPVAATAVGVDVSTEPSLNGFRDHLLQRRIGHKEPLQQTRLLGV